MKPSNVSSGAQIGGGVPTLDLKKVSVKHIQKIMNCKYKHIVYDHI